MGCFSFLCKVSGKAALSTSSDGSPCRLFLLQKGKVIEEMHGNYDSYGRVFNADHSDSFEWAMDWSAVCNLMFSEDESDGIAVVLDAYWDGVIPTTRSEGDPNQGWGSGEDGEEFLMGNCSSNMFPKVEDPYHRRTLPVFRENWEKRHVEVRYLGKLYFSNPEYTTSAREAQKFFRLTDQELEVIYRDYKKDYDFED